MKLLAMILSVTPFTCLFSESYSDLAKEATELVREANVTLGEKYKMGTWERWDLDQERGLLKFSNAGTEKLRFKACIVGSLSTKSETWLWSWANKSILEEMSSPILTVKKYGEQNAAEKLTKEKWNATEVEGWEVSAVACKLIHGLGVYRGPTGNGFVFIIPTELVFYEP